MAQHDIGAVADLEENRPLKVMAGETAILVIRRGSEVTALAHACPHFGLPLSKGHLDGDRLICPFHHACFDVSTGRQTQPPGHGDLRRYDIEIRDGHAFVDIPEGVDPHPVPAHVRRNDTARRVVIAGAGAAADACALTLREEGFEGVIEMISPEAQPPYDRTLLSKAMIAGGDPPRRLTLTGPEALAERDIDFVEGRVAAIDAQAGEIRTATGATHAYDALVIATGGTANRLDLPGADLGGLHYLRSRAQAGALAEAAGQAQRAVLVGGGFIGMEAALSLAKRGLEVTVALREEVPLARIVGEEIGRAIRAEHEAKGVRFVTGAQVAGFEGEGRVSAVKLDNGERIETDLALLAIGVRPATDIEGLSPDEDGGLRTGADLGLEGMPGVYAAGDVARVPGPWGPVRIEHWRVARQHGARVARAIMGHEPGEDDVPFFWTALGRQYRYLGHAEGWDEIRMDGEATGDFVARYVKDGRVMALLGAGRDAEIARAHAEMIRAGGPLPI
ncbi:FAD-dependent oxidoreductase [Limimaricola hongkongensis]|uniref:Dioxygenase, ferredoxin reductase component, putative n=1 Tax=Limimaricola hongkongensis DSM 17492 TaxID=1122180 RepID=A0A017HFH3_9RHOB|nr:FAD-dependent oxidoreductase [Limimaricola hongkongensis]EYD73096.1 dioxygenase, ferredoxin reductase component, putative [Limimaricola hongkongensis DSM 17492]